MKHLKRIGLGLSAFAVLFSLVSVALPAKLYAATNPNFNNFGGDEGALNKILTSTSLTVVNRARIKVTSTFKESLFSSVSLGSFGFDEAFSGTYVDTDISDSTYQWESPKVAIQNLGGNYNIYATGRILSRSKPPTVATSAQDTDKWAKEDLTLFLQISVDLPFDNDENYFFTKSGSEYGWSSIDSDVTSPVKPKAQNGEAVKIAYAFANNTIVSVDDRATYSLASAGSGTIQRFFEPSTGGKVLFDTSWNSKTDEEVLRLFNCDTCTGTVDVQYGDERESETVRVAQAKSIAAETDAGEDGLGGVSDADIDLNCDFSIVNPLSYFMCPLIEMASSGINMLDSQINNQLAVPIGKDSAFDENNVKGGKSLYTAWASFRTMALAILVVIALIMVISQAISSGPFDSYTVKKVLPRIIVAVIFITLSWQLCKLLIGISNDFGKGVGSVIASPFGGLKNPTIGASGQSIGTVASIIGFFSGLDFLVVLSFMLTGLAAVMIAFLVVAFRNILIIFLVITAPLALVLWILPNTQKAWSFWKSNFQAALLAFPIITGFIAIGRVFAILTSNIPSQNSSTLFRDVIVFFSYFGPYFALPAAFRLAGGAVASIGGIVNDRGKGFFDRNKKFRAGRSQQNRKEMQTGNRFKGNGSVARRLNGGLEIITNASPNNIGWNPTRMRSRMQAVRSRNSVDEALEAREKNHDYRNIMGNEDYLEAGKEAADVVRDAGGNVWHDARGREVRRDGSIGAARAYLQARGYTGRNLEQAVAAIQLTKRSMSNEAFNRAAAMDIVSTGTGYRDGAGEMMASLAEAAGEDTMALTRMIAQTRSLASQARRPDLAGGGFNFELGQAELVRQALSAPNADRQSIAGVMNSVTEAMDRETLRTQSGGTVASMKARQLQRLSGLMYQDVTAAANTASVAGTPMEDDAVRTALREFGAIAGRHDVANQISPEQAGILADNVLSQEVVVSNMSPKLQDKLRSAIEIVAPDPATGRMVVTGRRDRITVQQANEALASDPIYKEARKEYATAAAAGATAAAAGGMGGAPTAPPTGPTTIT